MSVTPQTSAASLADSVSHSSAAVGSLQRAASLSHQQMRDGAEPLTLNVKLCQTPADGSVTKTTRNSTRVSPDFNASYF